LEQNLPYGESEQGNLVGFLAMPEEAAEPLPGLLLFHEWWGLTEEIKTVARRLAREGYIVLATDFYGGRVAQDVAGAQALMTELVAAPERTRDNIRQAYQYLERLAFCKRFVLLLCGALRLVTEDRQHRLGHGRPLVAADRADAARGSRRGGDVLRRRDHRRRAAELLEHADARLLR
jgi:hypothetical protein